MKSTSEAATARTSSMEDFIGGISLGKVAGSDAKPEVEGRGVLHAGEARAVVKRGVQLLEELCVDTTFPRTSTEVTGKDVMSMVGLYCKVVVPDEVEARGALTLPPVGITGSGFAREDHLLFSTSFSFHRLQISWP
ncbi:hypothetical protein E2C01_102503 [Portunus trituberculatus]|uniref:Uncharacterized protein n=1 Tax=Portunus trituberculatus TaxID=210409 RepID=A0A5B7KMZ5_PORTR|nr:hypothetical protein [Portunus trituberculatus]